MKTFTLSRVIPFAVLAFAAIFSIFIPSLPNFSDTSKYNSADIAWVTVASALVFLMTPGLSFFYGGMVNRKNVISTMIKSFVATGVISFLWVVVGFGLSFGPSISGFVGNPASHFFFKDVNSSNPWNLAPTIPLLLFALFQMKFAIITPALVVGAVAERIKFTSYLLFIVLFGLLVYAPIAHWTWHPDGLLFKMGVLDFAGGTVVHISAGCAALAGAIVLKKRRSSAVQPANVPYVLLGTGLLWFGWFGFNAGSALAANDLAVSAFATTNTAAAVAGLAWMLFDYARGKKPSVLGFCIGAVVGLVAITPAAGFVAIPQSAFIGFTAAIISNIAVHWKDKAGVDDTLDVFACHGLGGIVGMILTGVFATKTVNGAGGIGLWYGETTLFIAQLKGLLIVVAYSFTVAFGIFKLLNVLNPIRVSNGEEETGLDETQHGEQYLQGTLLVDYNGSLVATKAPSSVSL
ncbi:ammonium transporter [Solitalea koreensis]|uniref:Ammonium transporter n=1 Tax=Solitalea koreensis TaxID=543615 RepID=A0A521EHE4_9SPHI|nr:ammonium transporter [Solitalea koreensis]SMO83337.1 ammonium transporter [Solitalea koreensis]